MREPAAQVCHRLAMVLLAESSKAAERLADPEELEALHDFRVTLRRLRTYLRAYRAHFPKTIARKGRRQLRRVMTATNAGRDGEVQIAWLRQQLAKRGVPKLQQRGLRLVLADLETHQEVFQQNRLEVVQREFVQVRDKLNGRLAKSYELTQSATRPGEPTFAATTSAILGAKAHALQRRLADIRAASDKKQLHRARLATKRLRYILEPIRALVSGGRDAVRRLKRLQDDLGDLHDLQTLELVVRASIERTAMEWSHALTAAAAREDRVSAIPRGRSQAADARALAAGVQRIAAVQRRLFRNIERRWLHDHARDFLQRMEAILDQMAPAETADEPPVGPGEPPTPAAPSASEATNLDVSETAPPTKWSHRNAASYPRRTREPVQR